MIPIPKTITRTVCAYKKKSSENDLPQQGDQNRSSVDSWDPTDNRAFSKDRKSGFYLDDSFPPEKSSLTFSGHPEFEDILDKIQWKRPFEINPDARMVSDRASSHDIKQQALGDCWFVSSCAAVAERPPLMSKILLCRDQPLSGDTYKGLPLSFQLFHNGSWVRVSIDDYLPVVPASSGGYRLVFSRSTSDNEMWVSLLEKAYAKLKGSFEGLVGGNAASALSDLTGGITEIIILRDEVEEKFWKRLKNILSVSETGLATASRGSLVEGEASEEQTGLTTHHAYTLRGCVELERPVGTARLVKVRNPWADDFEYTGAWNDNDPVWNTIDRGTLLGIGYQKKADGEFFMEFSEFMNFFRQVTICTLQPDFQVDGIVDKHFLKGCTSKWVSGESAGGCMNYRDSSFVLNPQFLLRPEKNLHFCLISVLQNTPVVPTHKMKLPYMGIYLYELTGRHKRKVESLKKLKVMFFRYNPLYTKTKVFANFQEAVIRCPLNANNCYVIIPCLFKPEEEAKFLLRVYADGDFNLDELTT